MTTPLSTATAPLSRLGLLSFAVLNLPITAMGVVIAVYLPRHYARHMGVDLTIVGTAFFIVRAISIPIDIILGWAMDRTRTKLGRYRPWILMGTPILAGGTYLLFLPPVGVGRVYLVASLLTTYLGISIMTLATLTWGANLAPTYNDRSRLFGMRAGIGVLGPAMVIGITILNGIRRAPEASNVPLMGVFIIALVPVTAALALLTTPERPSRRPSERRDGIQSIWSLVARPTMARLMLTDLCLSLAPNWMSAIYLFFFTDSRGFTTGQASILLAFYILAGIPGSPLMGRFATKVSKHRALLVAACGYTFALASFIAIPHGNMIVGATCLFVAGFLSSGFSVLTRAMVADVADETRLEFGRDSTGLLYSMLTMIEKLAAAMSIGLTFFVLSKAGYDATAGAVNSPEAVRHLEFAYLIGPITFAMLGGLCMLGYKLTPERHAEIRFRLDEIEAAYREAPIIESQRAEAQVRSSRSVAPGPNTDSNDGLEKSK